MAKEIKADKFFGDGSEITVNDLKLSEIVKTLNLMVPIGTIMAYGGAVHESDTAPEEQDKGGAKVQDLRNRLAEQGWLVCDGRKVKIEDYSDLYSAIGCAFGGDKKTYFYLPDLRGRFLRGVDHAAGQDPDAASRLKCVDGANKGDAVGSVQEESVIEHDHRYTSPIRWTDVKSNQMMIGQNVTDAQSWQTGKFGGKETRPKNINVNWIIKSKNII